MQEENKRKSAKYFAAANTYRGFKSYFDSIFDSDAFDRIYILKGGPGTGKSSFMRRIYENILPYADSGEEIYCSSDPKSLDGIILTKGERRIAILDGTAPHERDARIPGAKDEIIDLGLGWDKRLLIAEAKHITELNCEKSESYKTAYRYLSSAGKLNDFIMETYKSSFDKIRAKSKAETIFADISSENHYSEKTRLISSFGKEGLFPINTLNEIGNKVIKVYGDEASSLIFLGECNEVLKSKGINQIRCPWVLDGDFTDALYLPDAELAIIRSDFGDICADEYFELSTIQTERIKAAKAIHRELLYEAKRWFSIASDLHFRLEEIYGMAMNFEYCDRKKEEISSEIVNILEITR